MKFAPATLVVVAVPEPRIADVSCIVFTYDPKRQNVYAPTTRAKTRVTAMSIIVAMTGSIAFV